MIASLGIRGIDGKLWLFLVFEKVAGNKKAIQEMIPLWGSAVQTITVWKTCVTVVTTVVVRFSAHHHHHHHYHHRFPEGAYLVWHGSKKGDWSLCSSSNIPVVILLSGSWSVTLFYLGINGSKKYSSRPANIWKMIPFSIRTWHARCLRCMRRVGFLSGTD